MYKEPQEVEVNRVNYFVNKKKLKRALKSTGRDKELYNWAGQQLKKLKDNDGVLNNVNYLISKFEIVRRITGT